MAPKTPEGVGISAAFQEMGGDISASTKRKALELATRLSAVESGQPLKPGDEQKLDYLRREFKSFSGTEPAEYKKRVEAYRMPQKPMVDQKGEFDRAQVREFAAAVAGVKPNRITDLSKFGEFSIERGRITFKGDMTLEEDRSKLVSYDLEHLADAVLASHEIQEVYEGLRDIQYPHVGKDGRIESKTLLVFSREVAKKLETALAQDRGVKEFKEKVPERPKKVETAEHKRERAIRECQRLIDVAKARLRVYEGGDKPEEPGKTYLFRDLPEAVQDRVERGIKQLNEKRKKQGLPELFFNPRDASNLQDLARGAFTPHAKALRDFSDLDHARIWAVSTERTPTRPDNSSAYDPDGLVMVFTHPREAIRDLTRLREDIRKGAAEWPARVITFAEDFADGVEKYGMPGDPQK